MLLDASLAGTAAIGIGVAMVLLWLESVRRRDSSIVDIFWGTGFVGVALLACARGTGAIDRRLLITSLTTVWGLRLSIYIAWRDHGRGEDPRYQAMRAKAGAKWTWLSLPMVFGLQGALMWLISLPLQVSQTAGGNCSLTGLDAVGATLATIGIGFESIGDLQLARYKADPGHRGQVMDRGLWRYTRHPNYFGDFCVWWGLFLIAVAAGGAWTVISPLVMAFLLMRVSGVPMLERGMAKRPGYAEYIQRTSAFFPRPPR